jgi:MFS family permease
MIPETPGKLNEKMPKDKSKENIPWRFMTPLVLGTMMNPLNSTMLATALVTLCNSFKISTGQGAILITSLYMTATIAQPLMGRLADIYSAKKVNNLGFILVMIAALTGIFAPDFNWLVVSRILLGLGTSAAYPSAMALIGKRYALEGKTIPGPVLGIIAVTAQVSMVLGPTLGGFLTQSFGWRGIFIINVPWVIVGLLLSGAIPDYPPAANARKVNIFSRLDAPGILLFCAFLLSLLAILMSKELSWYIIPAAIISLAAFCIWEWRHEAPFIDVKLLARKPALSMVYVRGLATSFVLYLMLYGMPQWLQGVKHEIPVNTGLIMLPNTLTAIAAGLLIAKINKSTLQNTLGVILLIITCGGIFLLNGAIPLPMVICIGIIAGAAEGTNIIANQSLLNKEAPLAQKGVSFGLFRTFAYIGAILSGTLLKTIFQDGVTDQSFHRIGFFIAIACILLAVLLIPLMLKKRKLRLDIQK